MPGRGKGRPRGRLEPRRQDDRLGNPPLPRQGHRAGPPGADLQPGGPRLRRDPRHGRNAARRSAARGGRVQPGRPVLRGPHPGAGGPLHGRHQGERPADRRFPLGQRNRARPVLHPAFREAGRLRLLVRVLPGGPGHRQTDARLPRPQRPGLRHRRLARRQAFPDGLQRRNHSPLGPRARGAAAVAVRGGPGLDRLDAGRLLRGLGLRRAPHGLAGQPRSGGPGELLPCRAVPRLALQPGPDQAGAAGRRHEGSPGPAQGRDGRFGRAGATPDGGHLRARPPVASEAASR